LGLHLLIGKLKIMMVNPGAFQGTRLTFLVDQQPAYAATVAGNYVSDCVADIQRRYFK